MDFNKDTGKKTAELLLQIKAIKLNPQEPFTWASGWKSPIYCDNRVTLSYPSVRNFLKEKIAKLVEEKHGKPEIMNTDQGSQYKGADWIKPLTKAEIKISMDGWGRYWTTSSSNGSGDP